MECDICQRHASSKLSFNCDACAREALYRPRLALVQSVLKNDSLKKEVESQIANTKPSKTSLLGQRIQGGNNPSWTMQRTEAEGKSSDQRTQEIQTHVKTLREEVQHMKLDIAKRRARLVRRRKDFAAANEELSKTRQSGPVPLQRELKDFRQRWQDIHQQTIRQRLENCTKVASLFSLHCEQPRKGSAAKDIYFIGFLQIPEPREWNSEFGNLSSYRANINIDALPASITVVFLHLANLTHLISYYLALRLPAQLTLPTSAYPYPTILSPNVSYTGIAPILPGTDSSQSAHNSSAASRQSKHPAKQPTVPRARPLLLRKNLSALYRDDALTYAYQVEGMTLLAWNIAWLCKTQGLNVGSDSWEEVGAMGRNLWNLLLSPDSALVSLAGPDGSEVPIPDTPTLTAEGRLTADFTPYSGLFTHNSAYGFLAAFPASEYMHEWRLLNPIKVIARMKAVLLAERTGAEWEILDDSEWQEEASEETSKAPSKHRIEGNADAESVRIEDTGILIKPVEKEYVQRKDEGQSKWARFGSR